MEINIIHEQGRVLVTVLQITGAIDSSNYRELDQAAATVIQSGVRYIMLDLSKVHFMSSAALRSLQKIDRQLNALAVSLSSVEMQQGLLDGSYKSPYLKLLNPSPPVLLTLKTAGWDMVFEIHKEMREAVRSF